MSISMDIFANWFYFNPFFLGSSNIKKMFTVMVESVSLQSLPKLMIVFFKILLDDKLHFNTVPV